ncbi:MAG: YhbY family RNA-binding protein, partial [Clostridia bacterium]
CQIPETGENESLEARELIKIKILKTSAEEVHDAGETLAEELHAELAQTIGHTIVLYRKSKNKPRIELP